MRCLWWHLEVLPISHKERFVCTCTQQLRLLVHSTCDWARIRFRSAPTVVVKGINTLVLPLCILRLCCAYAPGGKPQQYTWSFGPVYDKIVHWGQAWCQSTFLLSFEDVQKIHDHMTKSSAQASQGQVGVSEQDSRIGAVQLGFPDQRNEERSEDSQRGR